MKIKSFFALSLFLLALLALSGCSSDTPTVNYSYFTTDTVPINSVDQNAQAELAETAQAVNDSLQQLSAIQLATHPNVPMPAPIDAQAVGMNQIVSVSWNGPVEPILKKIAETSNYQLNILGDSPNIPVLVNVNYQNVPLAEVLRDITYQVSGKATITVYPASKVIELQYFKNV